MIFPLQTTKSQIFMAKNMVNMVNPYKSSGNPHVSW
jgi:hypothetical protein